MDSIPQVDHFKTGAILFVGSALAAILVYALNRTILKALNAQVGV